MPHNAKWPYPAKHKTSPKAKAPIEHGNNSKSRTRPRPAFSFPVIPFLFFAFFFLVFSFLSAAGAPLCYVNFYFFISMRIKGHNKMAMIHIMKSFDIFGTISAMAKNAKAIQSVIEINLKKNFICHIISIFRLSRQPSRKSSFSSAALRRGRCPHRPASSGSPHTGSRFPPPRP